MRFSLLSPSSRAFGKALVIAIGSIAFFTGSALADYYTDQVQAQLDTLFPGKGYTVGAPKPAPSSALVTATNAAIQAEPDLSTHPAHNYVQSVLLVRTDSTTVAPPLVQGAVATVTAIGGSPAATSEIGAIAGDAAGVGSVAETAKPVIAIDTLKLRSDAVGDVVTDMAPHVADKLAFTKTTTVGLGTDGLTITAFVTDIINTGLPSGFTTNSFTLNVASAQKTSLAVGAVVGGGAATYPSGSSGESQRTMLANLALNQFSNATVNIADTVGMLSSDSAAFAGAIATTRSVQTKGFVAEGVVAADPAHAFNIVNAVIGADPGTITGSSLPTFAATAASGVTGNSNAVSNVASAAAGNQTQPLVDQIAAAVANKVPNAAPLIAGAIIANNTVTITSKPNFAVAISKASTVVKNLDNVASVANVVASTTNTDVDKEAVAIAVIKNVSNSAQKVSNLLCQLVSPGQPQADFAQALAAPLPNFALSIAVGVSTANEVWADVITRQVIDSSSNSRSQAGNIAAAVTKVVGAEESAEIAYRVGELINSGHIPLSQAANIAAAIAKVAPTDIPNNFPRNAQLAAIASAFAELIPSPATNSATIDAIATNVAKIDLTSAPNIAGSVAQAIADFPSLTTADRNNLWNALQNALLGLHPPDPNAVMNNITGVRNNTQTFTVGPINEDESSIAND
jgi:hypothetical protein